MAKATLLTFLFLFLSSILSPAYSQAGPASDKAMSVTRHVVARSIENSEPVDVGVSFPADVGSLVFFTHLQNTKEPSTVTHLWMYNGGVIAEVPLQVGSQSWRTWSRKRILSEWKGQWKVEVRGADGSVLASQSFTVQ